MPNTIGDILREELSRMTREEVRRQTTAMRRQLQDLTRRLAFLEAKERRRRAGKASPSPGRGLRFSPQWLKKQRKRLGLSASEYGKLIGASRMTILHWESGKVKPSPEGLTALAAVRNLGRTEAQRRLALGASGAMLRPASNAAVLREHLQYALAENDRAMTLTQLADAVLAAGYVTASKRFTTIISRTVRTYPQLFTVTDCDRLKGIPTLVELRTGVARRERTV